MSEGKKLLHGLGIVLLIVIVVAGFFLFYLPRAGKPCVVDNCHGLDISCGPVAPDACTEMYALGDSCRQYASCEKAGMSCRPAKSEKFDACKSCVERCLEDFKEDSPGLFQCEGGCFSLGRDTWSLNCTEGEYGIYNDSLGVDAPGFFLRCESLANCTADTDCDYLTIGKLPPRSGVCASGKCKAFCGSGILREC